MKHYGRSILGIAAIVAAGVCGLGFINLSIDSSGTDPTEWMWVAGNNAMMVLVLPLTLIGLVMITLGMKQDADHRRWEATVPSSDSQVVEDGYEQPDEPSHSVPHSVATRRLKKH